MNKMSSIKNIFIRKVDLSDLVHKEDAHKVVNLAYRSEGGWTTEKSIVKGERCTLEDIEGFILNNGKPNTLLFAYDNDKVIGTVQIQPWPTTTDAEIGLFSVHPQYQSRGIGGQLVRRAMDEMKSLGYKNAMMHVLDNRPEILQWYQKLGFKDTGERSPFVWVDKLLVDNVQFVTLKKAL
ncbi:acyl-CoA N-acyltransferase [Pilobolus umbonatus]|nr:acyl-CoA N-acyltransferase [Pilobolus umbonatus]